MSKVVTRTLQKQIDQNNMNKDRKNINTLRTVLTNGMPKKQVLTHKETKLIIKPKKNQMNL